MILSGCQHHQVGHNQVLGLLMAEFTISYETVATLKEIYIRSSLHIQQDTGSTEDWGRCKLTPQEWNLQTLDYGKTYRTNNLLSSINILWGKRRLRERWGWGRVYRLKRDLQDIATSHHCGPYLDPELKQTGIIFFPVCEIVLETSFLWMEYSKSAAMSLPKFGYKWRWLLSCSHSLSVSFRSPTQMKQSIYHVVCCSVEKPMWQRTEGDPWPIAREKLKPSVWNFSRSLFLPITTWMNLEDTSQVESWAELKL